jgi:hypothetical protein
MEAAVEEEAPPEATLRARSEKLLTRVSRAPLWSTPVIPARQAVDAALQFLPASAPLSGQAMAHAPSRQLCAAPFLVAEHWQQSKAGFAVVGPDLELKTGDGMQESACGAKNGWEGLFQRRRVVLVQARANDSCAAHVKTAPAGAPAAAPGAPPSAEQPPGGAAFSWGTRIPPWEIALNGASFLRDHLTMQDVREAFRYPPMTMQDHLTMREVFR